MGTRGLWGFEVDGVRKLSYTQYDSYPSYLGQNVVDAVKDFGGSYEDLADVARGIILIDPEETPTEEQIEHCAPYTNLGVGYQDTSDWYCLIREAQGRPSAYTDGGLRYMSDDSDFMEDNLFCEWVYIINCDNNTLGVWRNGNKLIGDYLFDALPDMQELEKSLD